MFYFTRFLLPVAVLAHLAATSALEVQDIYRDLPKKDITTLKAVTVRPGIQKREELFIPKHDYVHHYADRIKPRQMNDQIQTNYCQTILF
jgi:type II secretory pathway component PulK